MARSLNCYYWANEPLDEEVPYNSDDIIVGDSEIDESPHVKAERIRRRETIGQRYLLGHIPLIQTASLRGPFGSKYGWIAPWGRSRVCPDDMKPSRGRRNHIKDTTREEEIYLESHAPAIGKCAEAPVKEDLPNRRIDDDDDLMRYDADNEDDAFEEMNDEGRELLHYVEHLNDTQTRLAHLSRYKPLSKNSDDDISGASEKEFKQVIKRNGSRDSIKGENGFSQNKRKRKVDTDWLRGANVLKRSRYELFEHSSPTPLAGAVHEENMGHQGRSSPQRPGQGMSNGQGNTECLLKTKNCNQATRLEASHENSPLFGDHDEISFDSMKDSTDAFLMPNGQIVAADYGGLIYSNLGQMNVNGLSHASYQKHLITQSSREQQVGGVQLSPSELGVLSFKSVSSVRPLSRKRRSTHFKGDGKVSDNLSHGHLPTSGAAADAYIDGKEGLLNTRSPASEDSSFYRKTSRKSQGGKSSPRAEKGGARVSAVGEKFGSPKREAQPPQQTGAIPHQSSDPVSTGNARGFEIQESPASSTEKDGEHQHRSKSRVGNLESLSDLDVISSPDPLSEGFKDSNQQQIAPDVDQGRKHNPINLSNRDNLSGDCQRIIVTQVSPSHQQASGTQQSALRDLLRLSTSSIVEDNMEISMDLKGLMQPQLSDSFSKRSVLLGNVEDMDERAIRRENHLDGKLSSRPESSEAGNTPTNTPHSLKQSVVLAALNFKDNTEKSQPFDLDRRVGTSSDSMPAHVDAHVLEDLAGSTQSPRTVISVEPLQCGLGPDPASNDSERKSDKISTSHHLITLSMDETESATLSTKADEQITIDAEDRDEVDNCELFKSLFQHPGQDELGQSPSRFPSTQTLVNAATANPWDSVFKKMRRGKSDKRVSFGPLPSDVGEAASDAPSKPLERMESPPPPTGTLRLTQLDDPFHHRLKATRDLEVTEESLTKFMNTPWDDIPAIKPCAKPPSSSPAVAAMAEAFIAADKQSLHEKFDIKQRSGPRSLKPTEILIRPRIWVEHEPAELGDFSPPDASFSIAPSGRVTAVSIDSQGHDGEDNFHAVIEDMGSFLEGWDVESELKKAKGYRFEKGNDIKAPRKREYLSGISNR
jgi:hypothetical protein